MSSFRVGEYVGIWNQLSFGHIIEVKNKPKRYIRYSKFHSPIYLSRGNKYKIKLLSDKIIWVNENELLDATGDHRDDDSIMAAGHVFNSTTLFEDINLVITVGSAWKPSRYNPYINIYSNIEDSIYARNGVSLSLIANEYIHRDGYLTCLDRDMLDNVELFLVTNNNWFRAMFDFYVRNHIQIPKDVSTWPIKYNYDTIRLVDPK